MSSAAAGAWCAWLSGSGPTVAAMCAVVDADHIASVMAAVAVEGGAGGHTKVLRIDYEGASLEGPYTPSA